VTTSRAAMRAVRLSAAGRVDNLRLTTLPLPPERDGWVRIRVEAFGLNRSELKLRLGLSVGVSFPRGAGYRGCRHRAGSGAEGRRDDGETLVAPTTGSGGGGRVSKPPHGPRMAAI
jgi:NADPH:quinone reductase-like Zn-dependent oxidoreductase